MIAHRVLEFSIRAHASIPIEFVPMLDLEHPMPRSPEHRPRTTFSYYRFMIPELCGYQGRALYLDADMLVLGDVAELAEMSFGAHKVLTSAPEPTDRWHAHDSKYLGARSVAVMLLDCDRLPWRIDDIVRGIDEGRYTYDELFSEVCLVAPDEIADDIPQEWNHLERYDAGVTRLLHYTVVPTQPWKCDDNPLGELWMSWYHEAFAAGAIPIEEVEGLVASGAVKPSLLAGLPASAHRPPRSNAAPAAPARSPRRNPVERVVAALSAPFRRGGSTVGGREGGS